VVIKYVNLSVPYLLRDLIPAILLQLCFGFFTGEAFIRSSSDHVINGNPHHVLKEKKREKGENTRLS